MATTTIVRMMVRISNSLKTLYLPYRVALLEGVEPGVEAARGD
jgi:hypothetical protein